MANEKQVLTNCQRLIDPSVPIRDLTAMKSMYDAIALDGMIKALKEAPVVDAVPVDTVVEMFEYFLGDCPCNYSSTDGWLPECCELQEECPNPADEHGCWKQFIKHWGERREGECI